MAKRLDGVLSAIALPADAVDAATAPIDVEGAANALFKDTNKVDPPIAGCSGIICKGVWRRSVRGWSAVQLILSLLSILKP